MTKKKGGKRQVKEFYFAPPPQLLVRAEIEILIIHFYLRGHFYAKNGETKTAKPNLSLYI